MINICSDSRGRRRSYPHTGWWLVESGSLQVDKIQERLAKRKLFHLYAFECTLKFPTEHHNNTVNKFTVIRCKNQQVYYGAEGNIKWWNMLLEKGTSVERGMESDTQYSSPDHVTIAMLFEWCVNNCAWFVVLYTI